MKHNLYAVLDQAAQAFLSPFSMRGDGEARRAFAMTCQDPATNFARFASDYSLYRIGSFEDTDAVIVACQPPIFVARATEYVDPPEAPQVGQLTTVEKFEQECG